jgi:hypothetical protein
MFSLFNYQSLLDEIQDDIPGQYVAAELVFIFPTRLSSP